MNTQNQTTAKTPKTPKTRIQCTNGSVFVAEAASAFEEGQRFDGQNMISLATGSQWDHECLYRTARGAWVLHESSQWQGSGESYTRIDAIDARKWLMRNEHTRIAEKYFDLEACEI